MQWHRGCLTCAGCLAHLQPATLNEVLSFLTFADIFFIQKGEFREGSFLPPMLPERSSQIGDWDFEQAPNFNFNWSPSKTTSYPWMYLII